MFHSQRPKTSYWEHSIGDNCNVEHQLINYSFVEHRNKDTFKFSFS